MKDIAQAVLQAVREISREKGDFVLVALVLPDGSQDMWDVVLSAPWFPARRIKTIGYIADKLKKKLKKKEMLRISKIVLLDPPNPFVEAITNAEAVEDGITEILNRKFGDTDALIRSS